MSNDITKLITAFRNASQEMARELSAVSVKAVNDMLSLSINRVTQQGEDATGAQFSPYSTKPVAAWRYRGKSRTSGAENKVNAIAKKKGSISYKEFREINNLKSDRKNFEFTGEMFRKTGVLSFNRNAALVTIKVGGQTEQQQTKLDKHEWREGKSIISPSKAEMTLIDTYLLRWISEVVKKYVQ